MRTRQLEVFHAVYTHGSITGAAQYLHVSQPSVSKVLAHTENQLGFLLFQRIKRRLLPTTEAHILFKHADKIHNDLQNFNEITKNLLKNKPGLIRLASTPSIGIDLMPSLVVDFCKKHPEVEIETHTLHLDQIEKKIKEMSIDIALAYDINSSNYLKSVTIFKGNFVLLTPPHIFFKSPSVSCDDLKDLPFIKIEGPLSTKLDSYFKSNNFKPNYVTTTNTYQIAKSLVNKGMGITILDVISATNIDTDGVKTWQLDIPLKFKMNMIYSDQKVDSIVLNNFKSFLTSYNFKL
ncbi:MAG TPA: LysR family transcriptional regulator [Gammaproteobacteria bacterium]|nr:LysR family transcriptional regulator [Gammaproteobacteria bacterium]HIK72846.1 LysR family transcriptional regulator [Gammaproteobacteria bacterium]